MANHLLPVSFLSAEESTSFTTSVLSGTTVCVSSVSTITASIVGSTVSLTTSMLHTSVASVLKSLFEPHPTLPISTTDNKKNKSFFI